jgi:hypothetical protein
MKGFHTRVPSHGKVPLEQLGGRGLAVAADAGTRGNELVPDRIGHAVVEDDHSSYAVT